MSPSRTAFHAGAVTRRRSARSLTTACVSSPGAPARPSSCVPRLSSAPLPTTSIAAACANLAARARERAQAVPASCRRPQSLIAESPTHRCRNAAGGRGQRIWLYLGAHYAHWHRSGCSDSPHRLGGWLNRLMFRREVKHGHGLLFQRAGNGRLSESGNGN